MRRYSLLAAIAASAVVAVCLIGCSRAPQSSDGLPPSPNGVPINTSGTNSPVIASGPIGVVIPSDATDKPKGPNEECRANNAEVGIVLTDPFAPCIELSNVFNKLRRGTFTFNRPAIATVGESFSVSLFLLTAEGQTPNFDGLSGTIETRAQARFAQSMEATLSGDDFEITPPGAQPRTATLAQKVEWDWQIKPKSGGKKQLTINVAANIQIGADKNTVQITTLHESMEIQVTMFQRLGSYLAGANGAIAAAATTAASLIGLFSFAPKARQFFKEYVITLFRPKRSKRRKRSSQTGK